MRALSGNGYRASITGGIVPEDLCTYLKALRRKPLSHAQFAATKAARLGSRSAKSPDRSLLELGRRYVSKLLRHRVGLYEKALPNELSWEDKLKQTKELGFDFLEISVDESDECRSRLDWNDEEVYALRRSGKARRTVAVHVFKRAS